MTKTVTEVTHQAVRNLGISPQGGKTYTSVESAASTLFESLKRRDIVSVTSSTAIPDEWFLPLADLLADYVKSEFDRGADAVLPMRAERAELDLRRMRRGQLPST